MRYTNTSFLATLDLEPGNAGQHQRGMAMKDEYKTEPAHAAWFRSVQREIAEDYERLHIQALDDSQRAGHGRPCEDLPRLRGRVPVPAPRRVRRRRRGLPHRPSLTGRAASPAWSPLPTALPWVP